MTIGGVLAAIMGAGQDTLVDTEGVTIDGCECCTAGDACAETG